MSGSDPMTQAAAVWWGSTLMTKKTMKVNSDCSNNATSVTGDIELVKSSMISHKDRVLAPELWRLPRGAARRR